MRNIMSKKLTKKRFRLGITKTLSKIDRIALIDQVADEIMNTYQEVFIKLAKQ